CAAPRRPAASSMKTALSCGASLTDTEVLMVRSNLAHNNLAQRFDTLDEQPVADRHGRTADADRSRLATPLTLVAMSLGYGVVQLDVTIVNTALHSIGTSLGGGVAELQWIVNAYTIAFAALILTAGALGDRVGAKRVFMAGFVIFTAA